VCLFGSAVINKPEGCYHMGLGGSALGVSAPRKKLLAALALLGTQAPIATCMETLAVLEVLGMRAHRAHIARQESMSI
jgi:hypothetical protein